MNTALHLKSAALACAMILAVPAFAGDHGHGHGHGRDSAKHMDKMRSELNLTDEQASQFQVIMEETHEQMKALRDGSYLKMKVLLDDEQKKKFEAHHEKRMGKKMKMKERGDDKK